MTSYSQLLPFIALLPLLFTVADAGAAGRSRRLRREPTKPSSHAHHRQTEEFPPLLEGAAAALDSSATELKAVADEGTQALLPGWSVENSTTSFSMPVSDSSCHSAYVYCGQDASTCSLGGGWELDVSAMNLDRGLAIQCELRIGAGRCAESTNQVELPVVDTDAIVGAFEITSSILRSQLFNDTLGLVEDLRLLLPDGGPARRLSPFDEGEIDFADVSAVAQQLYHNLVWNLENYNIVLGGELSDTRIAIYATVCERQSDGESSAPGGVSSSSPSPGPLELGDATSDFLEPFPSVSAVSPLDNANQDPTSTEFPTVSPSQVPSESPTLNRGGSIPITAGSAGSGAAAAGSNTGLLIAIIAGCGVGLVASVLIALKVKKSYGTSVSNDLSSDSSDGDDGNSSNANP